MVNKAKCKTYGALPLYFCFLKKGAGISMDRELLTAIAFSLTLTLILETGFFFVAGKRGKKDLLLVAMVNVLTNPIVVLLYWLAALYTALDTTIVKISLELFAVLAEGYCYKNYGQSFKNPFLFSLAANAFSFSIGLLLQILK